MEIKLNYAHICDLAFVSQGGKANIIGIFKNITGNNFPVAHPKFSIIASFIVKNGMGKHKQVVRIFNKNNQQVGKEIPLDVEINSQEQEINFIWDIVNIVFEKPDSYFIKIFLDENEITAIPLDVLKI